MFDDSITSSSTFGNASQVAFNPTAQRVPANFTFSAYDYAWRNGTLPPFTTEEFALLPVAVEPLRGFSGFQPGENWTVLTTLFEADLECAEAHHINFNYSYWPDNTHRVIEVFRNESSDSVVRVCDALAQERIDGGEIMGEIGCYDMAAFITPWTSFYVRLTSGSVSDFMFGWASGKSGYPIDIAANVTSPAPLDITAIFCTPKYYAQTVNATVSMPSGRVSLDDVHRIGKREEMEPLQGFTDIMDGIPPADDSLGLEAVFVEGLNRTPPLRPIPLRFGYPPDKVVDLRHDLLEKFGKAARPAKPMHYLAASESNVYMTSTNTLAAFALSDERNNTASLEKLLDPRELESSIKKALKLWFTFAVVTETARSNERSTTIPVERKLPQAIIKVNPYWSLAARIGLPLIAALAILLTYLLEERPCYIDAEPSTMAAALKLLSASPALCAVMQHSEYHPIKKLMAELDKREFYFRMGPNEKGTLQVRVFRGDGEHAEEVLEGSEDLKVLEAPASDAQVQKDIEWVSPDLIAKANLLLFPILILALITAKALSKKRDGMYSNPRLEIP